MLSQTYRLLWSAFEFMDSRNMKRKHTAIDLFSGCGGLTLGLRKANFQVLGAIEIDSIAAKTYKENHRDVVVIEEDISNLVCAEVMELLNLKKGDLDLLAGCPPCQGFSTLSTLNGANVVSDDRNDLVFEFLRFVKELKPKTVMMENVPGLAQDFRFKTFLSQMEKMGYLGEYKVLNAHDYGVPQRRRRLIYLASLTKPVVFGKPARKKKFVRDAIGNLLPAGKSGDRIHDIPENRTPKIMALIKRIPRNGGSRTDLPISDQLECHKRCNGFRDVYGRMAWDKPAPTITGGCFNPSKGRFLHPVKNRAITMREAALLQGFPINYKFSTTVNKQVLALMIGNALPPEFIRRHANALKKSLP